MKMIMIVATAILALTATAHAAGPGRTNIDLTNLGWGKTYYSGR